MTNGVSSTLGNSLRTGAKKFQEGVSSLTKRNKKNENVDEIPTHPEQKPASPEVGKTERTLQHTTDSFNPKAGDKDDHNEYRPSNPLVSQWIDAQQSLLLDTQQSGQIRLTPLTPGSDQSFPNSPPIISTGDGFSPRSYHPERPTLRPEIEKKEKLASPDIDKKVQTLVKDLFCKNILRRIKKAKFNQFFLYEIDNIITETNQNELSSEQTKQIKFNAYKKKYLFFFTQDPINFLGANDALQNCTKYANPDQKTYIESLISDLSEGKSSKDEDYSYSIPIENKADMSTSRKEYNTQLNSVLEESCNDTINKADDELEQEQLQLLRSEMILASIDGAKKINDKHRAHRMKRIKECRDRINHFRNTGEAPKWTKVSYKKVEHKFLCNEIEQPSFKEASTQSAVEGPTNNTIYVQPQSTHSEAASTHSAVDEPANNTIIVQLEPTHSGANISEAD